MEDYLRSYTTLFFDETEIFPDDSIKHCKNNANEAHNIPLEVKKYETNIYGTRII